MICVAGPLFESQVDFSFVIALASNFDTDISIALRKGTPMTSSSSRL